MATDAELTFADHAGRFYAREYGFPPIAGRLLGYLLICDPPTPSIADLSEALLASRSAITGAVKLLEGQRIVRRARAAGERVDHISVDPAGLEPQGFEATIYQAQAALAREGLALLAGAPPSRRAVLEEAAALYDFLAERMPAVLDEWHANRSSQSFAKPRDPEGPATG